MLKQLSRFERAINGTLLVMLSTVVVLATIDLGWIIIKDMLTPPVMLLNVSELLELFGSFLLVLVGMELLNMVKAYIAEKTVHVEVTLAVSIIAIVRKVVILEPKEMDGPTLLGIAAIILALTVGYYLMKLAGRRDTSQSSVTLSDKGVSARPDGAP